MTEVILDDSAGSEEPKEGVYERNQRLYKESLKIDSPAAKQAALADSVARMDVIDKVGYWGTGENIAVRSLQRAAFEARDFGEYDDNFDVSAAFNTVKKDLHPDFWDMAEKSVNEQEFNAVLEFAQEQEYARQVIRESGAQGDLLAPALALIVDVDVALAFLSGGSYLGPKFAGTAARLTLSRSAKAASIGYGMGAGLEVGLIGELGNRALGMGYEWNDLPAVAAASMAFGTGFGVISKFEKFANKTTRDKLADVKLRRAVGNLTMDAVDADATNIARVMEASKKEQAATKVADAGDEVDFRPDIDVDGSAGAARINATFGRQYDPATAKISIEAEKQLEKYGLNYDGTTSPSLSKWEKAVDTFEDTVNMIPWFRTDFDNLLRTKAPSAILFAINSMENASGRFRTGKVTGALDKENIFVNISRATAAIPNLYKQYAKANNLGRVKGYKKNFANFQRLVAEEMDNRYNMRPGSTDPHVKAAADILDADNMRAAQILKARNVRGAQSIEWRSGWREQRWSADVFDAMIDAGVSHQQLERSIANGYRKANPTWSKKAAMVTAKAVIAFMRNRKEGINTNIAAMMERDGDRALRDMYMRHGMSGAELEEFMRILKVGQHSRGKANILKHRNEIDLTTPIMGTQYKISDLMNPDILRTHAAYARSASGHAMMGGMGITSRADWNDMVSAIKNEMYVNKGSLTGMKPGEWTEGDTNFMDYLWNAATGGPVNASVNVGIRRALSVSNLSLMNQIGFPQAAESINILAAHGFDAFVSALKVKGLPIDDPKYVKTLGYDMDVLDSPLDGLHNLQRPDFMLDDVPVNIQQAVNLASQDKGFGQMLQSLFYEGGKFDQALATGQRIQAYISGMFAVRHWSHMIHDKTFMHAIDRHIKGTRKFSAKRLADIGFTKESMDALRKDWKNVEYDGKVIKTLNIDKWSPESVQNLRAYMTRSRYQNVQEKLFGEGMYWMQKDMGAIMGNLRSFTLLALKKQTVRHARIADAASVAHVVHGLGWAGLVSWTRDVINGREDKYDPMRIMNRAWNYASPTGAMSMLTDPMLALLGLGDYQTGLGATERAGGVSPSFLPSIPVIDSVNRLARIPASMVDVMSGNTTPQDIANLSALPFGNAIGFNAIFNGMKADAAQEQYNRKRDARKKGEKKEPTRQQIKQRERNARMKERYEAERNQDKVEKQEKQENPENINALNALDKI